MKTLAHLSLVAVLALGTLPLAGCMADASTDEAGAAEEKDGPEGTAQAASTTGFTIYQGPAYTLGSQTYSADAADLGAWNNLAESLQNNSGSVVTVWSGKSFTGRCQIVLPGMLFPDLNLQDIGPQRLSSIQFGDHCSGGTSTMLLNNDQGFLVRLRTNPDDLTGSWSSDVAASSYTQQTFSKNAWSVYAEVQYYGPDFAWHLACGETWTVKDGFIGDRTIVVSGTSSLGTVCTVN